MRVPLEVRNPTLTKNGIAGQDFLRYCDSLLAMEQRRLSSDTIRILRGFEAGPLNRTRTRASRQTLESKTYHPTLAEQAAVT